MCFITPQFLYQFFCLFSQQVSVSWCHVVCQCCIVLNLNQSVTPSVFLVKNYRVWVYWLSLETFCGVMISVWFLLLSCSRRLFMTACIWRCIISASPLCPYWCTVCLSSWCIHTFCRANQHFTGTPAQVTDGSDLDTGNKSDLIYYQNNTKTLLFFQFGETTSEHQILKSVHDMVQWVNLNQTAPPCIVLQKQNWLLTKNKNLF